MPSGRLQFVRDKRKWSYEQSAADLAGGKIAPPCVHRGVSLIGNQLVNSEESCIYVNSADGAAISGNTFAKPSAAAVFINHTRNVRITQNTLTGGTKGGLKIGSNCNHETIKSHKNSGF